MSGLGLSDGTVDLVVVNGEVLRMHGPSRCSGSCPVHQPSDHPLRDAPLTWDATMGLMLRVCVHGELHPDPDSWSYTQRRLRGADAATYLVPWHRCCSDRCCMVLLE